MGQSASTPTSEPGMMEKLKNAATSATEKAKQTLGMAGVPDQLTSTPSATNTLGTGQGDTMLGGRRRKGKKSLKGGRRHKSKKTTKHR